MVVPNLSFLGPASAYPVTDSAFAGGSLQASLRFSPPLGEIQGPSLRVLTNSTLDGAALRLTPGSTNEFSTATRTSLADFAAAAVLANLTASAGSVSLSPASPAAQRFDAANNFGGGTHAGTVVVGNRLVLAGGASGTYTTGALDGQGVPWGFVEVAGRSAAPADIQVDVLYANGTALLAGLQSGARVPFTAGELPQLRLRLRLSASDRLNPPSVDWFGVGAQAGDLFTGANTQRQPAGLSLEGGNFLTLPQSATLTKSGSNPVIPVAGSTYRSAYISQPYILKVNGTWWLYATVNTANGIAASSFARATSPDLATWTWDALTVMNTTGAGIEAYGITHAYVVANPAGPGYIMYYTAWSSITLFKMARATSPDGVTWTRTGQVMGPGSGWEAYSVGHPAFVGYSAGAGLWLMYYAGTATTTGGGNSLGLAYSADGTNWTRYPFNPVLARAPGADDQDDAQPGKIISFGTTVAYYYSCNNGGYHVCLADTTDGTSWTKRGRVINASATSFESAFVSDPVPVLTDNQFLVFYAGQSGSASQLGVTTSTFKAASFTSTVDLLGPGPDLASFTKEPGNPTVQVAASTYRSAYISQPFVMEAGGQYRLYATVNAQAGLQSDSIAMATSSDLRTWAFLPQTVFNASLTGDEGYGVSHPYVLADPAGRGYIMYYTAWATVTQYALARATSPDGVNWTRTGVVLGGSGAGWDSANAGDPARVVFDETAGLFRMWYGGTAVTTGGGNSLGMATSQDGVNWTRWAGNPVMGRTSGGADQDDAQPGKIVEVGGTLALYYSCSSPANGYRVCAATSTNGGLSWTKLGAVVNRSVSGWDSTFVSDPAPVAAGRTLWLLYAGTGGGLSQLGLARGAADLYAPGARLSVQDLPRALARFQANLSQGAGVTATATLRSSATGSTWSATEGVTVDDATLTTPVQRYLQYTVALTAGTTRTRLAGALFDFEGTFEQGQYISDTLVFSDAPDALWINATVAGPGTVAFWASRDGGATFLRAPKGLWVDAPGAGTTVVMRADFAGRQSGAVRLDDVSVEVRMPGLPADVTLRAGAGGTPIAVGAGTLAAPVDVALDVAELQAEADALAAADPGAAFVDLPLFVNSSHFGEILVSDLVLNYTLKNPLAATFLPAGTTAPGAEGDIWTFEIQASTVAGAPLNYSWWVDGALVPLALPTLTFVANYSWAGAHTVTAQVENGDFTLGNTWDVQVANTNRAPVLLTSAPTASDLSQSHGQAANFGVTADDPDGDALTYTWAVDGAAPPGSLNLTTLAVAGMAPGAHTVAVQAADSGGLSASRSWNLNLTNAAPTSTPDPASVPAILRSYRQAVNLSVAAEDSDGDALTYSWFVDGAVRAGATSNAFSFTATAPGNHTVRVDVYDGFTTGSATWEVRFTNAAPQIASRDPAGARGLDQAEAQNFSAVASDGDGDGLTYAWALDGTPQAGAAGATFASPSGLAAGNHTVDLVVTDAQGATATAHWDFTVPEPPPPPPLPKGFIPGPGALFTAISLAAAAALVATARRRKL